MSELTDKLAKDVAIAEPLSSSEYSESCCILFENKASSFVKNTWKYLRKN